MSYITINVRVLAWLAFEGMLSEKQSNRLGGRHEWDKEIDSGQLLIRFLPSPDDISIVTSIFVYLYVVTSRQYNYV